MPKTIADLGGHEQAPTPVGKSMISAHQKTIDERIKDRAAQLEAENALLEQGGYDYDGNEAWIAAMENCGRR